MIGIGKYTGEMATWFSDSGHQVKVVTAPPYYPEWRIHHGYCAWAYRREKMDGVSIVRCPTWVPNHVSGLMRILHLASFALSSFPVLLGQILWRPDLIIVIEPPLFCAPTALGVALGTGAKALIHIQDFEVDAAFELGILPEGPLRTMVAAVERWLLRQFDCVSTISDRMLEKAISKGVDKRRSLLFPNWVDTNTIFPLPRENAFRTDLGLTDNTLVFLYSGNIGEKQGLEIVLQAAKYFLEKQNIHFIMCGNGAAYQRLRQQADGLLNISWLPLQPLNRLNELLGMADVHLLPQRTDAADLVMPSKLTGILASGRPAIVTASSGSQLAKTMQSMGLVVTPEHLGEFILAIEKLAANEDLRHELGLKSRAYAEEYLDKQKVLEKFNEQIQALCR